MPKLYYKFLRKDRKAPNAKYQWPKPGVWTTKIEPSKLSVCVRGYHVMRGAGYPDLASWWSAYSGIEDPVELWTCDIRGKGITNKHDGDTKLCVSQARLVKKLTIFNTPKFREALRVVLLDAAYKHLGTYKDVLGESGQESLKWYYEQFKANGWAPVAERYSRVANMVRHCNELPVCPTVARMREGLVLEMNILAEMERLGSNNRSQYIWEPRSMEYMFDRTHEGEVISSKCILKVLAQVK